MSRHSSAGGWAARRFWTKVEVSETADGHEILLDSRQLRTPGKHSLILPTQPLANAVAAEWEAQDGVILPETMPLTRAVNSAVERVAVQKADIVAMLADYGDTDLLCYQVEAPADLAAQQAQSWNPLLEWAGAEYGLALSVTSGLMPIEQDAANRPETIGILSGFGPFGLTALHDLITLPGSLVLGLAVVSGKIDANEAHDLSRLDEEHQAKLWGRDDEAQAAAEAKRLALLNAERLWHLLDDAIKAGKRP